MVNTVYKDISDWLNIPLKDINDIQKQLNGCLCDEWEYFKPTNKELIQLFYNVSYVYLFDPISSTDTNIPDNILTELYDDSNNVKILEFGCGVGNLGMKYGNDERIEKISCSDIGLVSIEFLKYRIKKYNLENKIETVWKPTSEQIISHYINNGDKFNLLYISDVLEHIPNNLSVLGKIIDNITNKDKSFFYICDPYNYNGGFGHPHLIAKKDDGTVINNDENLNDFYKSLGLEEITNMNYSNEFERWYKYVG